VTTESSLLKLPTANFMLAIYSPHECRPTNVSVSGFAVQTKIKDIHCTVEQQLNYTPPQPQTEISCINCTAIRQIAPAGIQHTVPFHGRAGQKKFNTATGLQLKC